MENMLREGWDCVWGKETVFKMNLVYLFKGISFFFLFALSDVSVLHGILRIPRVIWGVILMFIANDSAMV